MVNAMGRNGQHIRMGWVTLTVAFYGIWWRGIFSCVLVRQKILNRLTNNQIRSVNETFKHAIGKEAAFLFLFLPEKHQPSSSPFRWQCHGYGGM